MFLGTMCLNALDHPKEAFSITFIASLANILLNIAFIPVMGITGAAIATLIAMAVNAIGAFILLSRVITVKIEYTSVEKILCAAGIMGIFLLVIRFTFPFTHIAIVLAAVLTSATIYLFVLLRWDREIRDEIRNLTVTMGFPWPRWL